MIAAFKGVALYALSRHRLLFGAAIVIYLATFASFDALWALEGKPLVLPMLTFLRFAPFFLPLLLFVTAASPFSIDLASRESAFPRHFFTLPLGSVQLALPFVMYAVLLWAVAWALAIGITDGRALLEGPLQVPREALPSETWFPFLELSLLTWAQALMWTPFRRRGSRVVLGVALGCAHLAGLIAGISRALAPFDIVALCVLGAIVAACVGVRGVVLARRGDPPARAAAAIMGETSSSRTSGGAASQTGEPAPSPVRRLAFRSGIDAHVWYEWRLHGFSRGFFLSTFVAAIVLVPMLLAPRRDALSTGALAATGIAILFIVPAFGPFFANFVSNRYKAFAMPSFFAALPLSSGDFAWAKMRAAARSVALMCAIVSMLVALGAGLIDGTWPAALAAALRERYGALEGTTLLALAAGALPLFAISGTMNTIWIALADRRAVSYTFNALLIAIVLGFMYSVPWMQRHAADMPLRAASVPPEMVGALAALKLIALAVLIHRVAVRRLYPWPRIGLIGGVWLGAIAAMFAVCVRYVPGTEEHLLTTIATLVDLAPVLGVMGAPLALQMNRCR
ncbi:MAG TPA: hypothetical protein VFY39_12930 [Gammaproteobacteria bacterium]|nr:hypothetical protein [Gammaproteobacteria bacterium]